MCLAKKMGGRFKKSGIGYKIFDKSQTGRLYSMFQGRGKAYPRGIWLKEEDYRYEHITIIGSPGGVEYPPGFHIYAKRPLAIGERIYKVKYRGAHTVGFQDCERVLVAKEMKILEEISCID